MSVFWYCIELIREHDPWRAEQIERELEKWENCIMKMLEYLKTIPREARPIVWNYWLQALHSGQWDMVLNMARPEFRQYLENAPCFKEKFTFSFHQCVEILSTTPP